MNRIIKKIVISGFRSIEHETIKCDPVNVFCGTNDSGKSNILRALNLFFNYQTDFLIGLKFSDDYNKVAFAKAVRATKLKQQIKIRIYINPPSSYKSLNKERDVFIERAFDRNGAMTEKYSNDKKKAFINRLFNKIQYIYIPALKGRDVLQYIMGLIGSYELIEQEDITALNDKISSKTEDLREILNTSHISINTFLGLPTLLSDFWEKLSVDTAYEKTDYINENIKGTGERKGLNPNFFKIPLTHRGEGIKSKYVPPLLDWLNQNNPGKIYVWGIDEPENSLEFSLCEELATLYYEEYSKTTQCFLTTHSLAFMNPAEDIKQKPQIFRCSKNEFGSTKTKLLADLFKEQDKFDLFDDLGALNVQKELIEKFRAYKAERDQLKSQIERLETQLNDIIGNTKCVVLTEDKDTSLLESLLSASKFILEEIDIRTYEGCTNFNTAKILSQFILEKFPDIKILIHLDRDYKTDEEIEKDCKKFESLDIEIFFTLGTDIESHFINAEHISHHHPDITTDKASELIREVATANEAEAIKMIRSKTFGDKHKEKTSLADEYLKQLPKTEPMKYIKGKSMYTAMKQKIKDNTSQNENSKIHKPSPHISHEHLTIFAKKIWD